MNQQSATLFSKSVLSCLILALASGTSRAALSEAEILNSADARIGQHRKADAVVTVIDAKGKPIPKASITVEQTRHAFLFGSNIFTWSMPDNPRGQAEYRRRFAELLNYATLPFYWPSYEPQRGQPSHERMELVARWCKEQGIATKGHPLAWNYADASWYPDDLDELHKLQLERIDDCVRRFVGLIDRWDVVNEIAQYDRVQFATAKAPKHTAMWKKFGQIEFPRECFEAARKANPNAQLVVNDYRTEADFQRVIEQLVDPSGKRLYDIIGIQSHMHGGAWPTTKIWDVCERFAHFGVPLHFTETTILSGERVSDKPHDPAWPSTPEGEAYQARETARFYTVLFSHPAVEAITWWDFADARAWKGAPAGFLRKDLSPKPVYDELLKLIKGRWWTKANLETGPDGKAHFRGFLGDYRITVQSGGKRTEQTMSLTKNETNQLTITVQ